MFVQECAWAPPDAGLDTWGEGCAGPGWFPRGVRAAQRGGMGGAGVVAHSRWVAPNATLTRALPHLGWVVSPQAALPTDFYGLYDALIGNAVENFNLKVRERRVW